MGIVFSLPFLCLNLHMWKTIGWRFFYGDTFLGATSLLDKNCRENWSQALFNSLICQYVIFTQYMQIDFTNIKNVRPFGTLAMNLIKPQQDPKISYTNKKNPGKCLPFSSFFIFTKILGSFLFCKSSSALWLCHQYLDISRINYLVSFFEMPNLSQI